MTAPYLAANLRRGRRDPEGAMMAERPIIFSAPMVRAILDSRKTQTRRVIKPQPKYAASSWSMQVEPGDTYYDPIAGAAIRAVESRGRDKRAAGELTPMLIRSPYGQPGDRLWVRENTRALPCGTGVYSVDSADIKETRCGYLPLGDGLARWFYSKPVCPSIHMPRWASRITLEIVSFRIQRVQDITNADAIDEGIRPDVLPACEDHPTLECWVSEPDDNHAYQTPRDAFCKTWDSINAKRGFGWDVNPWVWVITFNRKET